MPPAQPLKPGDPVRLGDYELTGRLGLGDQGVVFLGRGDTGQAVAVKLLDAELPGEPAAAARFAAGLAAAKKVPGLCTARLLDAGLNDRRPYLVSEYVEGPSLWRLVVDEGPRGRRITERLAIGTATALAALHGAAVVHRDLTPGNVLLGADGPRVIDVGVSRALDSLGIAGHGVGIPSFMAPEQLTGTRVGPPADVFAWGLTMAFAATGSPPFGEDSAPEVTRRMLHGEPELRGLPGSLRDVVAHALSKDPGHRPTAAQLLDRLLRLPDLPDRAIAMAVEARAGAAPAAPAAEPPRPPSESETVVLPNATVLRNTTEKPTEKPTEQFTFGGPERFAAEAPDRAYVPGLTPGHEGPPAAGGRNGRTMGIMASVALGVLAGVAAIMLLLWLRLGGEESPPVRPTPSDGPVNAVPAAYDGTWRGTATNQRGVRFAVQVTFRAGRRTAEVRYPPPIGCDGTLALTRGTQSRLDMSLKIPRPCTGGVVTVTRQADGSLLYTWVRPKTRLSYRATLHSG
jgi:hypothetical protein